MQFFFDVLNYKGQCTEYGEETERDALRMYHENKGHGILQTDLITWQ